MSFKKTLNKSISILLIGVAISTSFTGMSSAMENNSNDERIDEIIESNVKYESDGLSIVSKSELKKDLENIDIEAIKQELKRIGIKQEYINNFNEDTIINSVEENIEDINKDIELNKIEVRGEKDLVDTQDENFYVQGGSTYSKKYSWGVRHYKSTAAANYWVRQLGKHINGIQLTSGASLIFAPYGIPAGVLGMVTVWYFTGLKDEVSYYNSRNNRGVIIDINTWLTYNVRNQ